jgi:hypothetical protein
MTTLPIYRVRSDPVPVDKAIEIAETAYRMRDFRMSGGKRPLGRGIGQPLRELRESRRTGPKRHDIEPIALRTGSHYLEIDGTGMWAADHSRMWRPELTPRLPVPDEAAKIAGDFLRRHKLMPQLPPGFRFAQSSFGGTRVALKQDGKREDKPLDIKVNHSISVLLSEPVEGMQELPIVGGGGKATVTVGDRGEVLGHLSSWRNIEGRTAKAELIDRKHADEQFRKLTEQLKVTEYEARLAYYAAPVFADQEYLYPVYVYSGFAEVGRQRVPLRQILIPATEFGPKELSGSTQPQRALDKPARPFVPPRDRIRRSYRAPGTGFEAGTSWIGLSGGLGGSQANAQGFVNGLAADGWTINFNWGDGNAWESDWRANDDQWVDAADFVFYTGHANMNGWVLSSPDDGFLSFAEVGSSPQSPGDLWGQNDLEWAIIAACGPLQDEVISKGGGDVFARWDGAFDGLHALLGYGAITFDNTQEGGRVVQYGKSGMKLIDAWLRTGQEIQPSTNGASAPDGPDVWVGAMYVIGSGNDPRNDHLWGHGSVSGDPLNPGTYVALWTTC